MFRNLTQSIAMLKQLLQWGVLFGLIAGHVVAQRPADHAERFNPAGEYHPFNRPADSLDLQFHLRVRYKHRTLVAWGDLYGSDSRFYKFRSVSVTEKHLRFATQRLHGVTYTFEGTFLRGGNFATQDPPLGSFLLQGTLRKFVHGKKAMELTTSVCILCWLLTRLRCSCCRTHRWMSDL